MKDQDRDRQRGRQTTRKTGNWEVKKRGRYVGRKQKR